MKRMPIAILLAALLLTGCADSVDPSIVNYAPHDTGDLPISTPGEQGVDSTLVDRLYRNAEDLETIYSLLVVKNGHLIAEGYFNEGSVEQSSGRQSATKSFTSALVGIALAQGCLTSVDQKVIHYFPEVADQIQDHRKEQITIRHLLQMRGGYPDEERTPPYLEQLFFVDNFHWIRHIVEFPLMDDPGTEFHYSNLSSHLLGIAVARACDTDLRSFAQEHLFGPLDASIGDWTGDSDGYAWGWGELYITARDMAKFGLLYLNDGAYSGQQVVPADWVDESLSRYSEGIKLGWSSSRFGKIRDIGYGYQWWSGRVGKHELHYALGHGGQYIILLEEQDMVIVATADPMYGPELAGSGSWKYEGPINEVLCDFIKSLPVE